MKRSSKTIDDITRFLFIGTSLDELQPSDLIIVLGNDFIDGTIKEVYQLYTSGIIEKNAVIVLSGASGALDDDKDLECNRLFDCAVNKYNMDPKMFIKESQAKNACQNFKYTKEIVDNLGGWERFESVLCIGKAFLLRRASMYAAKFGYPSNKMQYYGTVDRDGRNIGPDSWWKSQDAIDRVMAEIERIGKYYATGDLSIF